MVVLVSEHFDGVPWLERVYVAGTLWDAYEMGAPADIHAYTPAEFERKREQLAGRPRGRRGRPGLLAIYGVNRDHALDREPGALGDRLGHLDLRATSSAACRAASAA